MHIPNSFMALPADLSDYGRSKVAILPVPYDGTLSYRPGSRLGPRAIIEASKNVEVFDLELKTDQSAVGISTLDELEPEMSGPAAMVERVRLAFDKLLDDGKFVIMLGGEHSLTTGAVKALFPRHPGMSVLQIDAHLDLRDSFEGSEHSHACVMRRVREICPIVQVGIRSGCEEEYGFAEKAGLRPFFAHELDAGGRWMDEAIGRLTEEVFVTIDLDGLDPSVIPAVGTPEPGGLGWFETLAFLRKVCNRKRVIGIDIMELSPLPGSVQGDFASAKLAYKLVGYCMEAGILTPMAG